MSMAKPEAAFKPGEPVIVVDDQDQVLGHKRRDQVTYNDIYRVSALWLTNSQGKILIAQRSWRKDKNPGMWGPAAAGTLTKGETYESNMTKETAEELGIAGIAFGKGPKQFGDNGRQRYFRQWFISHLDCDIADLKIQTAEVEQVAWIDPNELARDIKQNPDKYTQGVSLMLEAKLS